MDGFVNFLTNGRSLFWDAYDLMQNPQARDEMNERVHDFIGAFSPFRENNRRQPLTLYKLQNVIDFTEYFTRHAAKGFLAFTVINIAVYHFTRLVSFIAMTYLVSIVFFGMVYLDTAEIAGASQDIKDILDQNEHSPNLKAALINEFVQANKTAKFNQAVKAKIAHNNVQIVRKRMQRMERRLMITRPIASLPIDQIIKHLRDLEDELSRELHVDPIPLNI